jgi:hypothetical protein
MKDIGGVRSSSTTGENIKLPTTENCPGCNEAYSNRSSSKRVCFNEGGPMTGDHYAIDGSQFINGWRARSMFMIGWEAE